MKPLATTGCRLSNRFYGSGKVYRLCGLNELKGLFGQKSQRGRNNRYRPVAEDGRSRVFVLSKNFGKSPTSVKTINQRIKHSSCNKACLETALDLASLSTPSQGHHDGTDRRYSHTICSMVWFSTSDGFLASPRLAGV